MFITFRRFCVLTRGSWISFRVPSVTNGSNPLEEPDEVVVHKIVARYPTVASFCRRFEALVWRVTIAVKSQVSI